MVERYLPYESSIFLRESLLDSDLCRLRIVFMIFIIISNQYSDLSQLMSPLSKDEIWILVSLSHPHPHPIQRIDQYGFLFISVSIVFLWLKNHLDFLTVWWSALPQWNLDYGSCFSHPYYDIKCSMEHQWLVQNSLLETGTIENVKIL